MLSNSMVNIFDCCEDVGGTALRGWSREEIEEVNWLCVVSFGLNDLSQRLFQ
jgi:hypothetical protein